jgi:hypothetical protein
MLRGLQEAEASAEANHRRQNRSCPRENRSCPRDGRRFGVMSTKGGTTITKILRSQHGRGL